MVVSTHSRLKAAGRRLIFRGLGNGFVSTHSRLKAAGELLKDSGTLSHVSTHSRLKAAGEGFYFLPACHVAFQHTAA